MPRIGIAGFMQESNSFAPYAQLDSFTVRSRDGIHAAFDDTNSEIMGFLDGCAERQWTPVPIVVATANSGGPVAADAFEKLSGDLVAQIRRAEIDAFLLALHGAMSTERFVSGDAEFAARLRKTLPPDIPVVATHDFHANVTRELLNHIDGITGYRTYPHLDQRETGRRAASILARILAGERASMSLLRIPLLLSPETSSTDEEPMPTVMRGLTDLFPESGGWYASLFCVQPWLDFEPVGGSVVVTSFSRKDPGPAMREVASSLWRRRREFRVDWTTAANLIERIHACRGRPVLISEAFDAPPAGSAGDNPALLEWLLPWNDSLKCCLFIVDPEIAALAHREGVGQTIRATLGGRIDPRFARSLPIEARIEHLSNGEIPGRTASAHGRIFSMGPSAVLGIGRIRMVVASRPVLLTVSPDLYRSQGIEPREQDVVGVKSALQFRYAYADISRTVLNLDWPGASRGRLEAAPFEKINRPVFPLDDFEWQPGPLE